jgi:hypothetical protein
MTKRVYQVRNYIPIRIVAYHAVIKSASPTFLEALCTLRLVAHGSRLESTLQTTYRFH